MKTATILWILLSIFVISCNDDDKYKECFKIDNMDVCESNANCKVKNVKQFYITRDGYNVGKGDLSVFRDIDPTYPVCFPSISSENGTSAQIIKYLSANYVLITTHKGEGYGKTTLPSSVSADGWKWIDDPEVTFKGESKNDFYCGDGIISFGEDCDVGQLGTNMDCANFNPVIIKHTTVNHYSSGNITCDASCQWDFSGCQ